MWKWFKELDRILRGDATQLAALERGSVEIPVLGISCVIVILGMIYGVCMGTFALLRPDRPEYMQMAASAIKTPALFLITLVITFPSLYVFNALVGSRLFPLAVMRLLIASLGVNLAVLSSLGPIVAFFSVTTTSYPFIVLLNVLVFAVAGMLGLSFLLQTLHRLTVAEQPRGLRSSPPPPPRPQPTPSTEPVSAIGQAASAALAADPLATMQDATMQGAAPSDMAAETPSAEPVQPAHSGEYQPTGALDRLEQSVINAHVRFIFRCWIFVFGIVGAQVGWLMRPFIGNPNQDFAWFRPRASNFFEAVAQTFWNLFF
ncbi:MAG TPA: hypothetical protein VGJ26_00260 [Pirellulales bacterium]|jgi:hypothetical protein